MSFVCPACGFKDYPCWRTSNYRRYSMIARLDELVVWDPELAGKIKDAINMLIKAGYKRNEISLFMIVNWKIPYKECLRKLDLMKVWNVKVCDCCYDGGYKYATPTFWTQEQLTKIRRVCRKHNQLVLFGIDPQPSIEALP